VPKPIVRQPLTEEKRKPVLKEKLSLSKKNMVQVHVGAKASAEEGRYTNTQTN